MIHSQCSTPAGCLTCLIYPCPWCQLLWTVAEIILAAPNKVKLCHFNIKKLDLKFFRSVWVPNPHPSSVGRPVCLGLWFWMLQNRFRQDHDGDWILPWRGHLQPPRLSQWPHSSGWMEDWSGYLLPGRGKCSWYRGCYGVGQKPRTLWGIEHEV